MVKLVAEEIQEAIIMWLAARGIEVTRDSRAVSLYCYESIFGGERKFYAEIHIVTPQQTEGPYR